MVIYTIGVMASFIIMSGFMYTILVHGIECKLVGNKELMHAYNQVYRGKKAFDIEPQSSEYEQFYINAMHGIERSGLFFKAIATRPDNILMDIEEWNELGKQGQLVSPANMELFNYVVEHGALPDQPSRFKFWCNNKRNS